MRFYFPAMTIFRVKWVNFWREGYLSARVNNERNIIGSGCEIVQNRRIPKSNSISEKKRGIPQNRSWRKEIFLDFHTGFSHVAGV